MTEDAADGSTDPDDGAESVDDLTIDRFYDAVEAAGRPVLTATQVARETDRTQAAASEQLDALSESGTVERVDVEADPVVYYPSSWGDLAARERVVLFPKRRQVVVDQPTQYTRAMLADFAHLVDSTGTEPGTRGYLYEIRQEDIWAAPYESFSELLARMRSVLPRRSPHLEEWVENQWKRARQFRLRTHEDGYVVLEADREELMGNVARQKLDGSVLQADLSDTESWVNEREIGTVKRVLYEAGYPVIDQRDLETGEPLDVTLEADLRAYQQDWVDRFTDQRAGVFVAPPGSGKTVAALGVLAAVGGETLVLVPSRELAGQWKAELLEHTDLTDEDIGEYHGGAKNIRPVTIATYQTAGMDRHRSLFDSREWGLIVYDECLSGDTVVETRDGRRTFAELDEEFDFDDGWTTDVDLSVQTYDPECDEYKFDTVTGVFKTESPVDRIETNVGETLRATPTHTHLVFDPETCEITEQRGVSEGEFLVRPAPSPEIVDVEEADHPEIELLGWLLGDGHMNEYGDVKFSFGRRADEQIQIISSLCAESGVEWSTFGNTRGDRTIRIPKARQTLGWEQFASDKTRSVRVPSESYRWSNGRIAALLRGLFDSEGSVDENGRIEFDTTSAGLATDVVLLVQKLGLTAKRHRIERDADAHGTIHRIYIPSFYRGEFRRLIGFSLTHKAERSRAGVTPATGLPLGPYLKSIKTDLGTTNRAVGRLAGVSSQTAGDVMRGSYRIGQHRLGALAESLQEYADGAATLSEGADRRDRHDITYAELGDAMDCSIGTAHRRWNDRHADASGAVSELIDDKRESAREHTETVASLEGLQIVEVTDVEREESQPVYDFETESHTFIADGYLTHNCHHIPSPVFRRSADLQSKHRLGLSATPIREDDNEAEIFTLIGPPIGTDWGALFDAGFVQEPEVEIRYVPWRDDEAQNEWASADGRERHMAAARNPAKADEVRRLREQHGDAKALVFVDYLDQGEQLSDALGVPFVSGETPHHVRQRLFEEFRQGEVRTLVVSRIADEGIDLPNAELAVVASGLGGSRRQGAQRAGRTMRPVGSALVYVLATRGTSEEDFAQRQMNHLAEKGIRVHERTVE